MHEYIETEDQSRNGVKVIVHKFYDRHGLKGTTVEADCSCFGSASRMHSYRLCPVLKELEKE